MKLIRSVGRRSFVADELRRRRYKEVGMIARLGRYSVDAYAEFQHLLPKINIPILGVGRQYVALSSNNAAEQECFRSVEWFICQTVVP